MEELGLLTCDAICTDVLFPSDKAWGECQNGPVNLWLCMLWKWEKCKHGTISLSSVIWFPVFLFSRQGKLENGRAEPMTGWLSRFFLFFLIDSAEAEWDEGPVVWPPVLFFFARQTRQSNCGRWQSGTSGQRATTWRMRVAWCATPPTSPNCVCQSFSPWNSWSKPHLNVSSPMPTPTTSTLYRSTVTRRHTSLLMTCASTCGIWKSLTRASVSLELCYWCVWCWDGANKRVNSSLLLDNVFIDNLVCERRQ